MKLTADKTIKNFLSQLATEGKSLVSIKNYKSDLNHFLAWAVLKLKSFGTYAESFAEIAPFINHSFFEEYKNFMVGKIAVIFKGIRINPRANPYKSAFWIFKSTRRRQILFRS